MTESQSRSPHSASWLPSLSNSRVLTAEEEQAVFRKFDIARHRWVGAVVGLAVNLPLDVMGEIFGKGLVVGRRSQPGTDEDVASTVRAIRQRMESEHPARRHSSMLKCVRLIKLRTFDSESITALEREVENALSCDGGAEAQLCKKISWQVEEMAKSAAAYRVLMSTILECNLKLVAKMAAAFERNRSSDSLMDFYQAGCMGLMIAIDRFDYRRKLKLSTYAAHWIRQAMQRRTVDYSQPTRKPSYRQDVDRRIRRELINLDDEEWRYFSQSDRLDEAARRAGLLDPAGTDEDAGADGGSGNGSKGRRGAGQYIDAMSRVNSEMSASYITRWCREVGAGSPLSPSASTFATLYTSDTGSIDRDTFPEEFSREDTQAEDADASLLSSRVEEVLATLTKREQNVIRWRYGLNPEGAENGPLPGHTFTLSEVGDALGLTRERVRQIQTGAMEKLQCHERASHLKGFL